MKIKIKARAPLEIICDAHSKVPAPNTGFPKSLEAYAGSRRNRRPRPNLVPSGRKAGMNECLTDVDNI